MAETIIETQRYIRPGTNEWVWFSTKPSTNGPTNPPRLPSELIKPMLPAAADSVKSRLGSAQNAGMYAFRPVKATVNSKTARASRTLNDSEAGINSTPQERGSAQVDRHGAVQPALAGAVRAPADQELSDQSPQRRDDHGPGQLLRWQRVPLLQDARQEELDAVAGRHHEEIGRGQQQHLGMLERLEDGHVAVPCLWRFFSRLSSCSRASRSSGSSQRASLGQSGR